MREIEEIVVGKVEMLEPGEARDSLRDRFERRAVEPQPAEVRQLF